MAEVLTDLREAFEALFTAPFASHPWASARGRSHWLELEGWQDAMAGPLSSIARDGGCGYVYPRQDEYFAGVGDPTGLRARLLEWHTGLAAGVERFAPATPSEAADLEFMRSVVGRMRELVERACVVEWARWEAARQVGPSAVPDPSRM
jgi:hypothetical protein